MTRAVRMQTVRARQRPAGCLVLPRVLGFACVAALAFLYLLTPVGGERE